MNERNGLNNFQMLLRSFFAIFQRKLKKNKKFQPCLDQELFSKVAALQPELDAEIEKYEKALEDWTK